MQKKIITITLILFTVISILLYHLEFKSSIEITKINPSVLSLLIDNNVDIYVNHDGLYRLDKKLGNWQSVLSGTRGYHPQDVTLGVDCVYYTNLNQIFKIERTSAKNTTPQLVADVKYSPHRLALSRDGKLLAYVKYSDNNFTQKTVMLIDLYEKKEIELLVGNATSIIWGPENSLLFFENEKGIFEISLANNEIKFITKGHLQFVTNTHLIYCNKNASAKTENNQWSFYKKNLANNTEEEFFKCELSNFQGITWDKSGRFMLISRINHSRPLSFDFASQLEIYDTKNNLGYSLPPFEKVTGCIFWEQEN